MARHLADLLLTMRELTLRPITTSTLLLPAPAQFSLVQPQLAVVSTRAVPTRVDGKRSIQATAGAGQTRLKLLRGHADTVARVLRLKTSSGHDLSGDGGILVTVLRRVELVRIHPHRRRGHSGRVHPRRSEWRHPAIHHRGCRLTEVQGIGRRVLVSGTEDVVLLLDASKSGVVVERNHHVVELLGAAEREMRRVGRSRSTVANVRGIRNHTLHLRVEATRLLGLRLRAVRGHSVDVSRTGEGGVLAVGGSIVGLVLALWDSVVDLELVLTRGSVPRSLRSSIASQRRVSRLLRPVDSGHDARAPLVLVTIRRIVPRGLQAAKVRARKAATEGMRAIPMFARVDLETLRLQRVVVPGKSARRGCVGRRLARVRRDVEMLVRGVGRRAGVDAGVRGSLQRTGLVYLDDRGSALVLGRRANSAVQVVTTINPVADLQADNFIGKLPRSSFGVFIDKLATVVEAPAAACGDSSVGGRLRIRCLECVLRRARREIGRGRVFGRYGLIENGGVDVGTALNDREI